MGWMTVMMMSMALTMAMAILVAMMMIIVMVGHTRVSRMRMAWGGHSNDPRHANLDGSHTRSETIPFISQ